MNRLSEYISGMKLTRQMLNEAKISIGSNDANRHTRALTYLIEAFDSFVRATNCAISIREKKKPKAWSAQPKRMREIMAHSHPTGTVKP